MSAIPPDVLGSAIQAPSTQRDIARVRDVERTAQSSASRTQARAIDEAATLVETSDNDTQVYADAEGSGSQGRAPDGRDEPGAEPELDRTSVERPPAPPARLDLQA